MALEKLFRFASFGGGRHVGIRGISLSARCAKRIATSEKSDNLHSFRRDDLVIERVPSHELKTIPPPNDLKFGVHFTDHMVDIDWDASSGWHTPTIHKMGPMMIHPAAKALHYATQLFEGMKAFRGVDNKIRMFRPDLNMARMKRTAIRSALPDFDSEELISIISSVIAMDSEWVPYDANASLYIRPTLIGTDPTLGVTGSKTAKLFVLLSPVGEYFSGGSKGVRLLADPQYTRAWRGGVGAYKMGSNYGPTIHISEAAAKKGCQQVLWLSGDEQWVTEAGAMNIFVYWKNEQGEKELITAGLHSETILPGVTRQSILDLTRSWSDFKVSERDFTMNELEKAIKEGRVYEMFGCGTAAVVSPVSSLHMVKQGGNEYVLDIPTMTSEDKVMERLFREITDIQYGRKEFADWTRVVEKE